MKSLLFGAALLASQVCTAFAWGGFDADSTDLVEISPEDVPQPGSVINVTNRDARTTIECIVLGVRHNARTIEVVAKYPDNTLHTLVMEGR